MHSLRCWLGRHDWGQRPSHHHLMGGYSTPGVAIYTWKCQHCGLAKSTKLPLLLR